MTALALVAFMWLAVLVPPALKRHNERRQDFLDSFQRGLGALEAATPSSSPSSLPSSLPGADAAPPLRPASPVTPSARRRTIFALLLASMAIAGVPAVAVGGKLSLVVFLAVADCFLVYVGLLVRWRDSRSGRRASAVEPGAAWDHEESLVVPAPRVRAAFPAG